MRIVPRRPHRRARDPGEGRLGLALQEVDLPGVAEEDGAGSVSVTGRVLRTRICPAARSIAFTRCDTADAVTCSRAAAPSKVPASTRAASVSS